MFSFASVKLLVPYYYRLNSVRIFIVLIVSSWSVFSHSALSSTVCSIYCLFCCDCTPQIFDYFYLWACFFLGLSAFLAGDRCTKRRGQGQGPRACALRSGWGDSGGISHSNPQAPETDLEPNSGSSPAVCFLLICSQWLISLCVWWHFITYPCTLELELWALFEAWI